MAERFTAFSRKPMNPEIEDKVVEALEELRIIFNLRQWRVSSLIYATLADTRLSNSLKGKLANSGLE